MSLYEAPGGRIERGVARWRGCNGAASRPAGGRLMYMMNEVDVLIAGAGPGGAALAARLADLGLGGRTLVLDRARFPRDKPCGGGLTGHAVEAMAAVGFTLDVEHAPAAEAEVCYGRFVRRVRLGRPVNIVRREEYDASLVAQVRARGLVGADGVGSLVRKALRPSRAAVEATPIRLFRAEIAAPPAWRDRRD